MDAVVLGDSLPEVTQRPSSAQVASLCNAGIEKTRKCLQGVHFVRCCHSTHSLLVRGFPGLPGGGQQQFVTQTFRVHLLGIDLLGSQKGRVKASGMRKGWREGGKSNKEAKKEWMGEGEHKFIPTTMRYWEQTPTPENSADCPVHAAAGVCAINVDYAL